MANLDGNGLQILWGRIQGLIRYVLDGVLGKPGKVVITDSAGRLSTSDVFTVREDRITLYETAASDPYDAFPLEIDDVNLMLCFADDAPESNLECVILIVDGMQKTLPRRHYNNDPSLDPCLLFGNTKYSGYGCPPCQDQADTGERDMVMYMDGMWGVTLHDEMSHAIWIGTVNTVISMDGNPTEQTDLINIRYHEEHSPVLKGTGVQSIRQNISACEAGGAGSFAANTSKANGRMSFAAGSGTATGEYACAMGFNTSASGRAATAFGYETAASGNSGFASGDSCQAVGRNAQAFGQNTVAKGDTQFVFGRFNQVDDGSRYVEIVGKGNSRARSNGRTLDWDGNEWLAGNLEAAGVIIRDETGTRYALSIQNGQLKCTALT